MGYDRNLNHNVENNHKGERGGGSHDMFENSLSFNNFFS